LEGPNANDRTRAGSAGIRGSKFRHGLLTLMIHSIDPLTDGGKLDILLFANFGNTFKSMFKAYYNYDV